MVPSLCQCSRVWFRLTFFLWRYQVISCECFSRALHWCSPRHRWTASGVPDSFPVLEEEQVAELGICSTTAHLPNKHNLTKAGERKPSSSLFSTFWFLLLLPDVLVFFNHTKSLNAQKSSFGFQIASSNFMLCVYFPWIISILFFQPEGAIQGLYSSVISLSPPFPPPPFFFLIPNERIQRVRMTSYAFLQLISLPPVFRRSQRVVTCKTSCQSSGWIWLTPEWSVLHVLPCGTAQTPCWYQLVSQVSFGTVEASPLTCLRGNDSISATWGHISPCDHWELRYSIEDSS